LTPSDKKTPLPKGEHEKGKNPAKDSQYKGREVSAITMYLFQQYRGKLKKQNDGEVAKRILAGMRTESHGTRNLAMRFLAWGATKALPITPKANKAGKQ